MEKFGFPYQGSKSKIALDILFNIPPAENFYDLFAGGCAITHAALLSNKWKNVITNDLQDTPSLFLKAIRGDFKNEKRWISRKDFFKLKDTEPYVRWIWSFGNNGGRYIFGKDIEQLKKEAHEYLFQNDYDYTPQTRVKLVKQFKEQAKLDGRFELEQLERLERLQQLERLERLQQLEQLEIFSKDYREIEIKPNSVVYCDIPYNQKDGVKEDYYGVSFKKIEFYEWARTRDFPVYFSSSFCDEFECVWQKEKQCTMNNKNSSGKKQIVEKLFWNGVGEHVKQTLF